MAQLLANGLVQFNDGRILYSDTVITGQDFIELVPLLSQMDPALGRAAMAGFPFVSGGGGGPGPVGPPGPPGGQIPPTPEAATFVVHPTPGKGDFTTIGAAVAALPATGGYILIREGLYPLAAPIVLPDKPIVFRGCGSGGFGPSGATTISPSGAFPAFIAPPGLTLFQSFVFEDLRFTGTLLAGQNFLNDASGVIVTANRVDYKGIDVILASTTASGSSLSLIESSAFTANTLMTSLPGVSVVELTRCLLFLNGPVGWSSTIAVTFTGSQINTFGTFTGSLGTLSVISGSRIILSTITAVGAECRFTGMDMNIATLVLSSGGNLVTGCRFTGVTNAIAVSTAGNAVTGCSFSGVTNPVVESPPATANVYAGNSGILPGSTFQPGDTFAGNT